MLAVWAPVDRHRPRSGSIKARHLISVMRTADETTPGAIAASMPGQPGMRPVATQRLVSLHPACGMTRVTFLENVTRTPSTCLYTAQGLSTGGAETPFPRISIMTLLTRTKTRRSTNPMLSTSTPNVAITPPREKP